VTFGKRDRKSGEGGGVFGIAVCYLVCVLEELQRLRVLALPADCGRQETPCNRSLVVQRQRTTKMGFRRFELSQRESDVSDADVNFEVTAAERQRALETYRCILMPLLSLQNHRKVEMGLWDVGSGMYRTAHPRVALIEFAYTERAPSSQ
jgi:hypothetical protein